VPGRASLAVGSDDDHAPEIPNGIHQGAEPGRIDPVVVGHEEAGAVGEDAHFRAPSGSNIFGSSGFGS
jgi:hypothetical protein